MKDFGLLVTALRDPAGLPDWTLRDWDVLIRQLKISGLMASMHARLSALNLLERIPEQPRRHLIWSGQLGQSHTRSVQREVAHIRQALKQCGVPVVLLKGAAYVLADLPCAAGRIFSDIDILVPKEKINEVESALMLSGWHTTHHDQYDQRYYRQWMHELPPMMHLGRATVIDVHHAILPLTARLQPDSTKLLKAKLAVPGYTSLLTLAPVDMVLHSAVHLFYDGEFDHALRDLQDIHMLLGHFSSSPGFWNQLAVRAQELDLARPLFYALRYTRLFFNSTVPDHVMLESGACKPNRFMLTLMDNLFERALLPNHVSCQDRYSAAARFALYVRGNWLRMPPMLLLRHLIQKAFISPKQQVVSE